jgi:hypothetical protein
MGCIWCGVRGQRTDPHTPLSLPQQNQHKITTCLGVVLHHALQPRGLLEHRPPRVRVLGVDEFAHYAVRLAQRRDVGLEAEDELVDVPCVCFVVVGLVAVGGCGVRGGPVCVYVYR